MNKGIIFAIGTVFGAAAGAAGMWFYNKKKEDAYIDEINELIKENEDLNHFIDNLPEDDMEDDEEDDEDPVEPARDDLDEMDGVKKYHHYKAESGMGVQALFEKKETDVTEGQKARKENPKLLNYEDVVGLDEINEMEFLEYQEKDYDPVYLNYDGNEDILLWGKDTDSESMAEAHFSLKRDALIGPAWRWFTDYIKDEDGTGAFYVKNDNLKKVFEVVVEYDPEGDVVE